MKRNPLLFACLLLLVQFAGAQSLPGASPAIGITIAGGNGPGSAPNQLNGPVDVFVDRTGNVYVADISNHRIQKWVPGATQGITVAGGNGPGSAPNQLNSPRRVFVDAAGNIYVLDQQNFRVQRWAPGASAGVTAGWGNGQGTAANQLADPRGLFVDAGGSIYVIDQKIINSNIFFRIEKWSPGATAAVTVIPQSGFPNDLFIDASGNIYLAEFITNGMVRKWAPGALTGVLVAGGNGFGSRADQLGIPSDVFVDEAGNVYVGDASNQRIQKWAPGAVTGITVAGGNGPGSAANQLNGLSSVFVDGAGKIYVADAVNNRVQLFQSEAASQNLTYRYYEGDWNQLPDFSTLTPVSSGRSANTSISFRRVEERFAFVWEGYINIPTPGTYTFSTVSDDGSSLYLNSLYSPSATPLVNNDGLHGFVMASGTTYIPQAGLYPIATTYFNKTGGKGISVYWSGPGFDQQLIPDTAFGAPSTDVTPPGTPVNLRVVSAGSTFINLDWDDATDSVGVTGYEVYVNGLRKYTTQGSIVSADNLTPGTSYLFTVVAFDLAGNRSAPSAPLNASTAAVNANGLSYQVYLGDWNELPNFSLLTPVKSGVSPNADISVRPSGVEEHFGIVWEGYINIPAAGTYTFGTVSDDGSQLYFNSLYAPGTTPLVNNDGLHGWVMATGTTYVFQPGLYPISIAYFNKTGGKGITLYWSGPGFSLQPIPNSAFVQTAAPLPVYSANRAVNGVPEQPVQEKATISRVYPVPFTDRLNIDFYNTASVNDIRVNILDLQGRTVYTQDAGKHAAGLHTLRLPLSGPQLPEGVYMVTLQINGKTYKTVPVLKAMR